MASLPYPTALAEHQTACEPGDTCVDMHDGAARVVKNALDGKANQTVPKTPVSDWAVHDGATRLT